MKFTIKSFFLIAFLLKAFLSFSQDVLTLNNEAMSSYKLNQKEAIETLKKALKIAKKSTDSLNIGRTKNNLAIVYRDLGQYKKSKELSNEALIMVKEDLIKASIYNNIGACNRKLGLYEEAISSYFKSLIIYEAKKELAKTATVNNNIAVVYSYLNLNVKSLEYHNKARIVFEELKDFKGISQSYNNAAIIYANEGDLEKSLKYFKYSLQLEKKLNDKKGIAESLNNVGSVHYYLGALDSAVYYFEKSAEMERNVGNFAGVSASYNNIAQVFLENKKVKKSKIYIDSAYHIAKKYNVNEDTENALLNYVDYYELQNENKKALNYLKKFHHYKDSISKKSNLKLLQEVETKYQTEKKEKEIALQKEELLEKEIAIKNRTLHAIFLASALLILGIIFFGIYKKNQYKRKQLQKEINLKDALATIKTQNRLQEQRLRISRDLHDNIGSQLTFIISSIDNLKYISKDVNDTLKDKLIGISTFTSETIHELRDTIWAMNKSEISVEDLHARILSFVEKAKIATQNMLFEVNYNIDKNATFSSLEGMNIFRVIQEAINNAIKYAEASKVEIILDKKENQFIASVIDNGVGFDIKNVDLGNGLSNMEKRMSEIKGKVAITSQTNKGTNVSFSVLIKNTSNDV
ncbi:sensor histidine kinase [Polaribacter pectinis]|uniref:histidine kinase n=1 Tax=Polaribacter pectinis TaxID=2738844 RepID=A0A7G9L7S4_9FLAO|nr:tetratricopeptide repeat protein [Polaribacter pectinis]QNM84673.1 sensor histidine kinase [Polaribacter pectinis]